MAATGLLNSDAGFTSAVIMIVTVRSDLKTPRLANGEFFAHMRSGRLTALRAACTI
jgi:hypothetical protein